MRDKLQLYLILYPYSGAGYASFLSISGYDPMAPATERRQPCRLTDLLNGEGTDLELFPVLRFEVTEADLVPK
ncbi:hypothetical protein EI77_02174 [Prosthecobacter fusiformis]|uniref:Uncharacterized protein n=1 Tax=Prosthecobacter fusiformis TaxID=48464 RepID=A0A4R7S0S4_9BACT|nr:hypothetical protein EI77_02174 [Prosthecobacter fusiformis]